LERFLENAAANALDAIALLDGIGYTYCMVGGEPMHERFYTVEEMAEVARVSPGAVRYWIRTGRLRGVKLGRQWRIRQADAEAFLGQGTEAPREGGEHDSFSTDHD